jgi:hypothetical protein
MPKKIGGNVYWIEDRQRTIRVVDAEAAFSDLNQAKAQVLFSESSGDKRQIRLARLAFRQFQGMRYRGEKKTPRRATEVGQQRISKPRKSLKARSAKKPVGKKPSKKRA